MNDDEKVIYFGETDARNKRIKFGIKKVDRSRHMYAIGKTGMGKSTLLENLAVQDILNGDGLAFIDPHGKSADLLLEYIPEHRIKDVIYFAPFDMDYPVSFNVMEDVGPEKRYLVANGLMSAFKKIWVDAWSARMEYILGNVLLALLEFPGSTLIAVNRMLTDKEFRKEVVNNVTDPSVKAFWVNEYANYTEKFAAEATPAIQNKVGQFVANPLIRNIIGQPKSSFDIRDVMDNKKILIINLSKGRVGEANANLLGAMLITKIYLGAMSRADLKEKELKEVPNFYLYVDEFQSFANESFADILSEARKYKLNLCIAHQYIEQMTEEVRAAVFGNVGTMAVFRVGAYDAEVLEKEFAPHFTAEDIVNLQKYQMYLKLMIDGVTSQPFSAAGMSPIPRPDITYVNEVIEASRAQYAHPRAEVEENILTWIQTQYGKGAQGGQGGGQASGQGQGGQGGQNQGRSQGSQGGGQQGGPRYDGGGGNRASQGNFRPQEGQRQPSQPSGASYGPAGSRPFGGLEMLQKSHRPSEGPGQGGEQAHQGRPEQRRDQPQGQQSQQQNRAPQLPHQDRPQQAPQPQTPKQKANDRERKLADAISLSYLRQDAEPKKDPKVPKPENVAALREALLSVMKIETPAAESAPAAPAAPQQSAPAAQPEAPKPALAPVVEEPRREKIETKPQPVHHAPKPVEQRHEQKPQAHVPHQNPHQPEPHHKKHEQQHVEHQPKHEKPAEDARKGEVAGDLLKKIFE